MERILKRREKSRERTLFRTILGLLSLMAVGLAFSGARNRLDAASSQISLKDGRILTGAFAPVDSVATRPEPRRTAENTAAERLVVVDDQLRLTYVPKLAIQEIFPDDVGASLETFRIPQPSIRAGGQPIAALGAYRSTVPFDEFGRRTLSVGGTPLVQGITEITPRSIRVQGINFEIDMRLSPHSFSRDILTSLIKKQINPKSLDERLRIYRFYVQAELFEQAAEELEEIIHDFESDPENTEPLDVGLQMIRQMAASRLMSELELRQRIGQHRKVRSLLAGFDAEGVAFDKIQAVRKMVRQYEEEDKKRQTIIDRLTQLTEKLDDAGLKEGVKPILTEIERELNPNTTDRFSEFLLSENDATINDATRLAIGLSGWLVGNAGADPRPEIAVSLFRVRQLIRKYLLEKTESVREGIWESIREEEASSPPDRVARLLQRMKPPLSTRSSSRETPGYYELEVPSYETGKNFRYCVQLPPEYDPNRKYPAILTLHGERTIPSVQIDWWAGPWVERKKEDGSTTRERYGQAGRYGFIVIAPQWAERGTAYDYSPLQNAPILYALRDAFRRFSIDTDRVFLSGHSAGGDAAFDLGFAHPDLFAGLIPICGSAEKYPYYLRKNAEFIPVYGVGGELDGGRLAKSRLVYDDGMNNGHPFDMTFVLYKGRGNESFSDEIIRIFEWMRLRSRNFAPKGERTVFSMRPWDNFFWNVELFRFPDRTMIAPLDWISDIPHSYYAARTDFLRSLPNSIKIKSKADHALIFLSPEIVDFSQKIEVYFNGKKLTPPNGTVLPELRVLLDDVRTRADRQHPFWAVFNSEFPGEANSHWEKNEGETPEPEK